MSVSLALGVLGGTSPTATLRFLQALQAATPVETERDHLRVICDINPALPAEPVPGLDAGGALAEMAGALRGAGAEVLAIAGNAAHAHAGLIQRAAGLPLVDMIQTAASAAQRTGLIRVGVMGTRPALRLYREYLAAQAMGLVALSPERQAAFLALLQRVRGGERGPSVRNEAAGFARDLVAEGAEAIIAGSLEAAPLLARADAGVEVIDPGDLLARRCVSVCLGLEPLPGVLA